MRYIKTYNESSSNQYYTSGIIGKAYDINRIDIDIKDINKIKSGLGMTNEFDTDKYISAYRGDGGRGYVRIKCYDFYYNMTTGEIGNFNTIADHIRDHSKDIRLVSVESYKDEWFSVIIRSRNRDNSLLPEPEHPDEIYWCDQVEGVVKCVQDSIDKDKESSDIKLYENLYYSKLDEPVGYYIIKGYTKMTTSNFTKDELDSIESKLDDRSRIVMDYHWHNGNQWCIEIHYYTDRSKYGNCWIEIQKFEDEWFYVSIHNPTQYKRIVNGKVLDTEYYKCDQIEGLLKFIEDKKKEYFK